MNDQILKIAKRTIERDGRSQQSATWYLMGYFGISEQEAQIAVLDVSFPGGFEAWYAPGPND